jgi:hypothetical protein
LLASAVIPILRSGLTIFRLYGARVQAGVKLDKAKIRDQVRTVLRLKHYSLRTEKGYVDWIKRFILFDGASHKKS